MLKLEDFKSIDSFIEAINTRKTNEVFATNEAGLNEDYDFTSTHNIEEANDLLRYGYFDVVKQIKDTLKDYNINNEEYEDKQYNSVVGFLPLVPLYLSGIPDCMLMIERVQPTTPTLEITFDVTVSGGTPTRVIIGNAIKLLVVIDKLIKQGVAVKLNIIPFLAYSDDSKTSYGASIQVKDYNEEISIEKLAYFVCHPSCLRRHGFRYIETVPYKIPRGMCRGHGSVSAHTDRHYKEYCGGKLVSLSKIIRDNLTTTDIEKQLNIE